MKMLFHMFLTFALVLPNLAAKAITTLPSNELGPKITITFELGRKSRGCEKIGICNVSFEGSIGRQTGSNGDNTATGTAWLENGRLKISFDRTSMTEATYLTHFGSGNFQLEEDYILPTDIATALGVRSYTIKTGKYAVPQATGENSTLPITF